VSRESGSVSGACFARPRSSWSPPLAPPGNGIVTEDGRPHLGGPQVKEAVIKALTYITTAYKERYVPPAALSWNDADATFPRSPLRFRKAGFPRYGSKAGYVNF